MGMRRCGRCGRFAGIGNTTQYRFYPGKYSETSARRCNHCGWARFFFKFITTAGFARMLKIHYAAHLTHLLNMETPLYDRFRRVA